MASGSVLATGVASIAGRVTDSGPSCGTGAPDTPNSEKLPEWQPSPHSFAPPHIGGDEAAAAQALADFFFRENAQTRCTPVKVDHGDNAVVLAKCAAQAI